MQYVPALFLHLILLVDLTDLYLFCDHTGVPQNVLEILHKRAPVELYWVYLKLKTNRPHPYNCQQTPIDYKHTDKHWWSITSLQKMKVVGQLV